MVKFAASGRAKANFRCAFKVRLANSRELPNVSCKFATIRCLITKYNSVSLSIAQNMHPISIMII